MSQDEEKAKKELPWNNRTEEAKFKLKGLEDERIAFDENPKRRRKQIIYEIAEKLDKDGMPIEWVQAYIIRKLSPDGLAY
jgi:hypothetical protein